LEGIVILVLLWLLFLTRTLPMSILSCLYLNGSLLSEKTDGLGCVAMWVVPFSKITSCNLKIAPVFQSINLYSSLPKYPSKLNLVNLGLYVHILLHQMNEDGIYSVTVQFKVQLRFSLAVL